MNDFVRSLVTCLVSLQERQKLVWFGRYQRWFSRVALKAVEENPGN